MSADRSVTLSIGDFARATHLTVKTLRYYHEQGLLDPVDVDRQSGYRRYGVDQITTAQIIRRLRDLDMPVDEVRDLLRAEDASVRNELIAQHLRRMEAELGRVQGAVGALRELLEQPARGRAVQHRHVPALRVAAIRAVVPTSELGVWMAGAFGELYAALAAQGASSTGVAGGVYANELFEDARGEALVYVPSSAEIVHAGRIEPMQLPAVDLAILTHEGNERGLDLSYGALADHVARHALAVPGPIREFYPVSKRDTDDATQWRTEIGWPVFPLVPASPR